MSHGLLAVVALIGIGCKQTVTHFHMWGHTDSFTANRHLNIVSACKATFADQSGRCTLGWLTASILNLPVNIHLLHGIID